MMAVTAGLREVGPGGQPYGTERQRSVRLFGCALLLVAESIVFLTLIAIRFLLGAGHPAGLDQAYAVGLTALMAVSLAAMYLARRSATADWRARAAAALFVAAGAGLLTALGVGYGWTRTHIPADSRFGEAFYATTGAHAVHLVLAAIVALGLAIQTRQGRLGGDRQTLLRAVSWFWTFLFVVWVVVYVAFYLL